MHKHYANTKQASKGLCILIGLIFMAVSVLIIVFETRYKNTMDSQIESSYVTHTEVKSRKSKGSGYSITYRPQYHYNIDGQNYICSAVSSSSIKSYANRTVYYRSYEPNKCLVDEGPLVFFFKLSFFIVGLFTVICQFKSKA